MHIEKSTDMLHKLVYSSDSTVIKRGEQSNVEGVFFPENVNDVVEIVREADSKGFYVLTRGRGTSVSAKAVPVKNAYILSMEKMDKVMDLDVEGGMIKVQAGITVKSINELLEEHGLELAAFPASYKYSSIGGNISTNAAGLEAMRYGAAVNSVKKMQVVTGRGDVIEPGSHSFRDSIGGSLLHLFAGSFGNYCIITNAVMGLNTIPRGVVESSKGYEELHDLIKDIKRLRSDPSLIRMEIINNTISEKILNKKRNYIVVRSLNPVGEEKEGIKIRNSMSPIMSSLKDNKISADICISLKHMMEFDKIFHDTRDIFTGYYGHIGEGLIHVNVCFNDGDEEKAMEFYDRIMNFAKEKNGSISGEHGITPDKYRYLSEDQLKTVEYMKEIKKVFDPKGILNPGAL